MSTGPQDSSGARRLIKCPTGIRGLDEHHGRRFAQRATDPCLRRSRLWQDPPGHEFIVRGARDLGELLRNMRSIDLDLQPHLARGRLRLHTFRPTLNGLENHLVSLRQPVIDWRPDALILDPITNFAVEGDAGTSNHHAD